MPFLVITFFFVKRDFPQEYYLVKLKICQKFMEDRFNAPNIIGLDVDRRKPEMAEEHIGQI